MFTINIFRRELGIEKPAYPDYCASFSILSAATIYARALETNVSAFRITVTNEVGETVYNRHWGCPLCFERKDLYEQYAVCATHKMCPNCLKHPRSLDSHDLKEYGWCLKCIEPEAKRIAAYERREHEYVFGDA